MKNLKIVSAVLGLLVIFPIWTFLVYQILVRVNASELMWFLFWIYLPVGALVGFISRLTEGKS